MIEVTFNREDAKSAKKIRKERVEDIPAFLGALCVLSDRRERAFQQTYCW